MPKSNIDRFLIVCSLSAILASGHVLYTRLIAPNINPSQKTVYTESTRELSDNNHPVQVVSKFFTQFKASSNKKSEDALVLEEQNTIVLRAVVTEDSMNELMNDLQKKSNSLPKSATIYLVLDTPGGSVDAGNRFISMAKAIHQKVKTITIFAASMGFHIAQNLDERIILDSGTLMSHRMSISGLSGEFPGELLTFINYLLKMSNKMDAVCAERMQLSTKDYQELIRDEYWVYGEDAVTERAADKVSLVRCGKSMSGTSSVRTKVFGIIDVELVMSKCPLIPGVISMRVIGDNPRNIDAQKYIDLSINNKEQFVRSYIKNNKFMEYQK